MSIQYKIISKVYGLLDTVYFRKKDTSPRVNMLKFIPNEKLKILEVCIGTAENSIVIAENRPKVEIMGIDLSKDMLKLAEEKIEKRAIKNIKTLIMDATNMSFEDKHFDVVLISLVLHEVNKDTRDKIIKESQRVLKNDGKIIILEWDKPKKVRNKILFSIIELLEPKGFKEFLQLDMKEYLNGFSLEVVNEKKCDYSKVIEIRNINKI